MPLWGVTSSAKVFAGTDAAIKGGPGENLEGSGRRLENLSGQGHGAGRWRLYRLGCGVPRMNADERIKSGRVLPCAAAASR